MIVVIVAGIAFVLMGIEYLWPGRRWPSSSGWWPRALAINGFQIASVFLAGVTWEHWLRGPHLLSLSSLGRPAELVIGYLIYAVWMYWSHRARHGIPALWRHLHQLHHSPQRIEILTAFYKHPVEIVLESITSSALLYVVLGISPLSVFIISTVSGVANLFYHWNISTPRWLGYVIQRPESHCIHHERDVHAFNYSELPLVDMVFGTFRNPPRFDRQCGFAPGREQQFGRILLGGDVNVVDGRAGPSGLGGLDGLKGQGTTTTLP
jgi:sterol desaturase/sphingolipid hydroxylase (fatty acid hydroxylase superfamily)